MINLMGSVDHLSKKDHIEETNIIYNIHMCNREIHIQFLKMDQSYCLYCDKYLKILKYQITKQHDECENCNSSNYYVHENGKYCNNCSCLINYFNADLQPYDCYFNKKQSIYHRKYYIINTLNEINKKYNILMSEYQKYIILEYCNKIIEWQKDNNMIKKINLKYVIRQIYIEFLKYRKCYNIKIRNNVRKTNEYLIIWNKIKEIFKFDIHDNI